MDLIGGIGFDGYCSIEIFREEYWQQPLDQVVNDAKASIDRLFEKTGVTAQ